MNNKETSSTTVQIHLVAGLFYCFVCVQDAAALGEERANLCGELEPRRIVALLLGFAGPEQGYRASRSGPGQRWETTQAAHNARQVY